MSASQNRLSKLLSHLNEHPVSSTSDSNLVLTKVLPSGIGVIILNNPPVNSLPFPVINGIDIAARKFQNDSNIKAVIITGQNRFFCGGADINILQKTALSTDPNQPSLIAAAHPVLNNIEDGNKPFIAAINGFALGGGCELAMGCHYRIMSTQASIGLVEANLGLIPGFGGTQRLPRLMGLNEGIYAILTGKQFSAKHAERRGIVDEISQPNELLKRAEIVALEFAENKRRLRRSLYLDDKIPNIQIAKQQVTAMRKRFSKLFQRSPAAEYAITAIMGIYQGPKQGLQVEIDTFDEIIKSPSAKGQLHLFFSERATTKIDIPIKGKMVLNIQKVAVLGGGTMGSGIAALLLSKGYRVILKEISSKYMDMAYQRIYKIMQRFEEKGKLKKGKTAKDIMDNLLKLQIDYSGFNDIDLVIEAALESLPLKQKIFKQLAYECNNKCILATNTSTINIDKISDGLSQDIKERIIGLHFFSPAHIMQLLEVIRTSNTSPVIISDMVKLSKKLKKIPVIVGNCVGFAANRMFFPLFQAAHFLVEHGICPYRIDNILEEFGMAMGPNKTIDLSGIDIFHNVEKQIKNEYNYAYDSSILNELVKLNRLGQKTKHGIYIYDDKRNRFKDNDGLKQILWNIDNRKQFKLKFNENDLMDKDIINLCLFPVVNEAFKILNDNYANKSSDLDIISVTGYGFPRKCGGVLFWAKHQIGLKFIVENLTKWSNMFDNQEPNLNLKRFFMPCPALIKASNQL